MKSGARALGIAESYSEDTSQFAGAVVRANRVVDGFVFGRATVGGSDATDTVCSMVDRLNREDIRYLFVAGIAPAWFNVIDCRQVHERTNLPVLSVSFEASSGLEDAIGEAFDDPETVRDRVATYRAQPARQPVGVNGETVYVRSVGTGADTAADVVRAFTPEGGRPEPLRVARLAARGVAELR